MADLESSRAEFFGTQEPHHINGKNTKQKQPTISTLSNCNLSIDTFILKPVHNMLFQQGLRQLNGRTTPSTLKTLQSSSSSLLCHRRLLLGSSSIRTALSSTKPLGCHAQILPWRHDPRLPDRVLQHNDYSGAFNPTARDPPILRKLIAARELNIPVWDVLPIPFYKHDWEVDLALNFAVAFEFAIGELLGTLFRGMYDDNILLRCFVQQMMCPVRVIILPSKEESSAVNHLPSFS